MSYLYDIKAAAAAQERRKKLPLMFPMPASTKKKHLDEYYTPEYYAAAKRYHKIASPILSMMGCIGEDPGHSLCWTQDRARSFRKALQEYPYQFEFHYDYAPDGYEWDDMKKSITSFADYACQQNDHVAMIILLEEGADPETSYHSAWKSASADIFWQIWDRYQDQCQLSRKRSKKSKVQKLLDEIDDESMSQGERMKEMHCILSILLKS